MILANIPILLYVIRRQTGPRRPKLELRTRGSTASWKLKNRTSLSSNTLEEILQTLVLQQCLTLEIARKDSETL